MAHRFTYAGPSAGNTPAAGAASSSNASASAASAIPPTFPQPIFNYPILIPSHHPNPADFSHDRERASSLNAYDFGAHAVPNPGSTFEERRMKRRSRSFTDLSDFAGMKHVPIQQLLLPIQMGSYQWPATAPYPAVPTVNGKVAISRAPDGIMGKPVHIVTKQEKKLAHSAMERRYRKELNVQISLLKQLVPSTEEETGTNPNKVAILKKATEYVRTLRHQEMRFEHDISQLGQEEQELFRRFMDNHEKIRKQQAYMEHQQRAIQQLVALSQSHMLPLPSDIPNPLITSPTASIAIPSNNNFLFTDPLQGAPAAAPASSSSLPNDPFDVNSIIDSYAIGPDYLNSMLNAPTLALGNTMEHLALHDNSLLPSPLSQPRHPT